MVSECTSTYTCTEHIWKIRREREVSKAFIFSWMSRLNDSFPSRSSRYGDAFAKVSKSNFWLISLWISVCCSDNTTESCVFSVVSDTMNVRVREFQCRTDPETVVIYLKGTAIIAVWSMRSKRWPSLNGFEWISKIGVGTAHIAKWIWRYFQAALNRTLPPMPEKLIFVEAMQSWQELSRCQSCSKVES